MNIRLQLVGYMIDPDSVVLPVPVWRKMAEMGTLISLGLCDPPGQATPSTIQRMATYAILALLDAQPGDNRFRLFRLWRRGEFVSTGPDDRLPGGEVSDVDFISASASEQGLDLRQVYVRLRVFILERGGDPRPLWRRQTSLPWPRTPDLLTVRDVASRLGVSPRRVLRLIRHDLLLATALPGTRQRTFYLIREHDLKIYLGGDDERTHGEGSSNDAKGPCECGDQAARVIVRCAPQ